jgi:Tol biopolymer transport system component
MSNFWWSAPMRSYSWEPRGGTLCFTVDTIHYHAAERAPARRAAVMPTRPAEQAMSLMRSLLFLVLLAPGARAAALQALPAVELGEVVGLDRAIGWARVAPDGQSIVLMQEGGGEAWLFERRDGSLRKLGIHWSANVVWSPHGSQLAFGRSDDRGGYSVWTLSTTPGAAPRRLAVHDSDYPVYSPDGSSIAYARHAGADCEGCQELLVVPARGGEPRVSISAVPGPFAWSRDGRWIYYHTTTADTFHFMRVAPAGDVRQTLFTTPRVHHIEIGLSPDDRYLAVAMGMDVCCCCAPGSAHAHADLALAIWTADGRHLVRHQLPHGVTPLAWTPDNRIIAVRAEPHRQLRIMNADGSRNRMIAADWSHPQGAVLSPDGARLAFQAGSSDDLRLGIMPVSGAGARILDDLPVSTPPVWSPDGRTVAVVTRTAAGMQIAMIDAATGSVRRGPLEPGIGGPVGWRADGRGLLYSVSAAGNGDAAALRELRADAGSARNVSEIVGRGRFINEQNWTNLVGGRLLHYSAGGARVHELAENLSGPFGFSADARRFAAAVAADPGDNTYLMRVGIDALTFEITLPGGLRPVAGTPAQWHPSGTHFYIIVRNPQSERQGILAVPVSGAAPRLIPLPADEQVTHFTLTADGSRIVYAADLPPRQVLLELDVTSLLR